MVETAAPPRLTVLPVSDSFSGLWASLASECGLRLVVASSAEELKREAGQGVAAVCVAGMEASLQHVLEDLGPARSEVALVGALPDHRVALAAARAGAADYFALPQDMQYLRDWLIAAGERRRRGAQGESFAILEGNKYHFDGILGESAALRNTLARAARIIPHPSVTVLINGETGTGKELLARGIHYNGPRRAGPFVDLNCAALPEHLLESELFGHEKGAFTDASTAKPGLFELAHGGTLFLDEIGHLSIPLQGKLLRVLEQRTIRRVGGTRNLTVDVRIIAATHVDLAEAVQRGEFREDLYYRLHVVPLVLPPLRARGDDLFRLADHFLERFAREYAVPRPALTPAARRRLQCHPWSGNIRELRNVIERALLLGQDGVIDAPDLGLDTSARQPGTVVPFPATLSEMARAAARAMTDLCGGNKSESARRLGISRTRLLRLLAGQHRTRPLDGALP